MPKSQFLLACILIVAGYILATALNRPLVGQPPRPEPVGEESQVWRYQLMSVGEGATPRLFLTDTVTGRVWTRFTHTNDRTGWLAYGSPASSATAPADKQ
jgi:hypothetical protein